MNKNWWSIGKLSNWIFDTLLDGKGSQEMTARGGDEDEGGEIMKKVIM